jgi:hypothetical protein
MVFLLIKFFAEIAYQWITVTHLIFATRSFSSFVVPNLGMGVNRIFVNVFSVRYSQYQNNYRLSVYGINYAV